MSKLIVYCTVPHYGGIYSVYRRIREAVSVSEWSIKCLCFKSELKDWYGYDPALINDDVVVLDDSGLNFAQSCYMFIEWLIKNQPKVLIPVSSKIAVSSIPWVPLTCHVVSRCVDITPYVMKLVTANYRYVSKVIYTSPRQAHELIQKHQCSNDKLVNIPNTLDPMSSYSYHPPLVGEVVRLVFFDRLDEHQKAVSIVPTIIQGLLAKGYSVNLDIIGDGPARKVLADSLSVSKLGNLTTFHGALQQSSAFEIIRKSHFLIKPTRFEGFPSSLLEATVNGAFPVCSNIDGVTNWILEENAFLAEIDNANSFCNKIDWAIKNPETAVAMHSSLVLRLEQRFGFEDFRNNWLGLLNQLESIEPVGERLKLDVVIKKHSIFNHSKFRKIFSKLLKANTRRKLKEFFGVA